MKRPQIGPLLVAVLLVLWACAMVALVIIGFTRIQPQGTGSAPAHAVRSSPPAPAGTTHRQKRQKNTMLKRGHALSAGVQGEN
jgi:hypothetical protein